MANENKILTAEQEKKLLQPIDDYVGKIQSKIDALRADGTEKVISLQDEIDSLKKDKIYTKEEKDARLAAAQSALDKAKAVEAQNKDEIAKLIADAENYLKAHYDAEYYQPVCERRFWRRRSTARGRQSLRKLTRRTCRSSPTARRSRTRSTFTRTAFSTPRWSMRKISNR